MAFQQANTPQTADFVELAPRAAQVIPANPPPDHFRDELQELSRRVAFDPDSWSQTDQLRVRKIFDERAESWGERRSEDYLAPLKDGLERGGLGEGGRCLEIGAATGLQTPSLTAHFSEVVSVDLSIDMLARFGVSSATLLVADGAHLPFADDSFDAIVLVNVFVFIPEYLRVLHQQGRLLLASTRGSLTPIYLAPRDLHAVAGALSGERIVATSARVAAGDWTVLERTTPAK